MKIGITILLAICSSLVASDKSPVDIGDVELIKKSDPTVEILIEETASDASSIMSKKALESFLDKYSKASSHKAFAQSKSGEWAWRSNQTTAEYAATAALLKCQHNNQKLEEQFPCKIINMDDRWGAELYSLTK